MSDQPNRAEALRKLEERAAKWHLNSDDAWVSVKLGEIRATLERRATPEAAPVQGVKVRALVELVRDALIFASWAGGEGLCPGGIPAPEDFIMGYSAATGDEDWETLPERVAATLAALEPAEAQGWRPIETAPRDGTAILLFMPDHTTPLVGSSRSSGWGVDGFSYAERPLEHPTHWMPLPASPAAQEEP